MRSASNRFVHPTHTPADRRSGALDPPAHQRLRPATGDAGEHSSCGRAVFDVEALVAAAVGQCQHLGHTVVGRVGDAGPVEGLVRERMVVSSASREVRLPTACSRRSSRSWPLRRHVSWSESRRGGLDHPATSSAPCSRGDRMISLNLSCRWWIAARVSAVNSSGCGRAIDEGARRFHSTSVLREVPGRRRRSSSGSNR